MLDFTDQVIVVTGAGSPKGIGRVIAKTLLLILTRVGLTKPFKLFRMKAEKLKEFYST